MWEDHIMEGSGPIHPSIYRPCPPPFPPDLGWTVNEAREVTDSANLREAQT